MLRPITERMLEKLKECSELEKDPNHKLCPPSHFGYSLPGLYKRGLVAVKNYVDEQGKSLVGVYLTQKALTLLKEKNVSVESSSKTSY